MNQKERVSNALLQALKMNHGQWKTAREIFECMIKISGYAKFLTSKKITYLLKELRLLKRKRFSELMIEYYCDLNIKRPKFIKK